MYIEREREREYPCVPAGETCPTSRPPSSSPQPLPDPWQRVTCCNTPATHPQHTRNTPATHPQHTALYYTKSNILRFCLYRENVPHAATHPQHTRNTLQHTATHCNSFNIFNIFSRCLVRDILSHTATYCNVLQHIATHSVSWVFARFVTTCQTLQRSAKYCNILQHAATHRNTLPRHAATIRDNLWNTATKCNIVQHTATHCNTLQHAATRCITLQHTATHSTTHRHNTQQPDFW